MSYTLNITFHSNEHPFSTVYSPGRAILDDSDAVKWAVGMSEGLGNMYSVTLMKDGCAIRSEGS